MSNNKFGYELGGILGASQYLFDGDGGFQPGGFGIPNQFRSAPAIPSNGLVARWNGGSRFDTSGSENVYDGILSANPPTLVTGINNEANGGFAYDGIDQDINFGNIVEIKGVSQLTITTWFRRLTATLMGLENFLATGIDGSGISWNNLHIINAVVRNGGVIQHTHPLVSTAWTSIMLVFNGSLAAADRNQLFVDNVKVGTTSGTPPTLSANNIGSFIIGSSLGTFLTGQSAQTLVYDRAINADERAAIFAQKME